ncbi:MAG: nucleotidyltransferase domain-containing protein [Candidatus Njordarchaeales archaeon]
MDNEKIREIKKQVRKIFDLQEVHSILIFGSFAKGEISERSDIDICVVAPGVKNKEKFTNKIAGMLPKNYDVCLFELLPLYMKIEVIKNHIVLYTKDILELYEYFYHYRKLWKDQEHRQKLTLEEAKKLFSHKE